MVAQTNNRNYGIDLLRIVCMFMVCCLHIVGGIVTTTEGSAEYWVVNLLRAACLCAVNCYALISGYVGLHSKHNLKSIISLWLVVVFYSVSITLISFVVSPDKISILKLIKAFLPVISVRYWYFSAYFLMYFMMPLVNGFVAVANKKQRIFVLFAVVALSLGSTVFGALGNLWSVNDGFSVFWLLCMYLVGAILKDHPLKFVFPWVLVFGISVIMIWLSKVVLYSIGIVDKSDIFLSYTSPFIIISAISLFMFFVNMKVKKKTATIISIVGPSAFSVYIIHYNKYMWQVCCDLLSGISKFNVTLLPFIVLLCTAIVFVACILIDFARRCLFKIIKVGRFCDICEKKLKSVVNMLISIFECLLGIDKL